MNVVVTSVQSVANDVVAIQFESEDGTSLPGFTAGAHVDVKIREGLVRQYSLYNSPSERKNRYCIGVHLSPASRGGSIAMHALNEGDRVTISAPRNNFQLVDDAENVLLIAGGIGITPMLSMTSHLHESGRAFHLFYSGRERKKMGFREMIEASPWANNVTFQVTGDHGPFLDLESILAAPSSAKHVYVCGPGGMIDAAIGTAQRRGWVEANIHRERFSADGAIGADDREFVVEIASSGMRLTVRRDESIAQALRKGGIAVPTSCEQGICGTCLTGLTAGLADHRDDYLTDEEKMEGKQILLCCSRAKTDTLVLDL